MTNQQIITVLKSKGLYVTNIQNRGSFDILTIDVKGKKVLCLCGQMTLAEKGKDRRRLQIPSGITLPEGASCCLLGWEDINPTTTVYALGITGIEDFCSGINNSSTFSIQYKEILDTFNNGRHFWNVNGKLVLGTTSLDDVAAVIKTNRKSYKISDLQRFKYLLEYFVAHLQHMQKNVNPKVKETKGYTKYLANLISTGNFAQQTLVKGSGPDKIQDQISAWREYNVNGNNYVVRISINGGAPNNYKCRANFLHWKDTHHNIGAEWDANDEISALKIYESDKNGGQTLHVMPIDQLGLFDLQEPNSDVLNFWVIFAQMLTENGPQVDNRYLQRIYYGTPGTGKSFAAKKITKDMDVFRTTFHPDTDFSSFVGSYKPNVVPGIVRDSSGMPVAGQSDKKIEYAYTPQIFMKAYCKAWNNYLHPGQDNIAKSVCLLIEEVNRGNCAQIFGDIFQLLDRNDKGFSEYSIFVDSDLQNYLRDTYLKDDFGAYYRAIQKNSDLDENGDRTIPGWDDIHRLSNLVRLCLPPNLSIICTMNTSDQSLFPMDSAFKRRWDWSYVPIEYENGKSDFLIMFDETCYYKWAEFLNNINDIIYDITKSEDKQMGNFFVKGDENMAVDCEQFISKVMYYLWSEICKDNPKFKKRIFVWTKEHELKEGETAETTDYDNDFSFSDLFSNQKIEILHGFMLNLKVKANAIDKTTTSIPKKDSYMVNGNGPYNVCKTALAIMREYCAKKDYAEIETKVNGFKPALKKYNYVIKVIDYPIWQAGYKASTSVKTTVYFDKPEDKLISKDGIEFYFYKEWKWYTLNSILQLAEEENITVE